MNTFTVYEHINRTNGKRYVGITERRPEDRWGTDGYNYRHSSPRFGLRYRSMAGMALTTSLWLED